MTICSGPFGLAASWAAAAALPREAVAGVRGRADRCTLPGRPTSGCRIGAERRSCGKPVGSAPAGAERPASTATAALAVSAMPLENFRNLDGSPLPDRRCDETGRPPFVVLTPPGTAAPDGTPTDG